MNISKFHGLLQCIIVKSQWQSDFNRLEPKFWTKTATTDFWWNDFRPNYSTKQFSTKWSSTKWSATPYDTVSTLNRRQIQIPNRTRHQNYCNTQHSQKLNNKPVNQRMTSSFGWRCRSSGTHARESLQTDWPQKQSAAGKRRATAHKQQNVAPLLKPLPKTPDNGKDAEDYDNICWQKNESSR